MTRTIPSTTGTPVASVGPVRWLVGCLLVVTALAAAGCGGGSSSTTLGGGAARLVSYHGGGHGFEGLSFRYPASWSAYHYRCASSFTSPIVYLSNERLHPPCTHRRLAHGSVTKGRAPLDRLRPGGVLVEWSLTGFPGSTFKNAHGRPLRVDGFQAKLLTGEYGCAHLGADVGYVLTVNRRHDPYNRYELRACIAGPDSASTEAEVRGLISSTTLPTAREISTDSSSTAPGPIVHNGSLAGRLIVEPAPVAAGEDVGVAVRNEGSVPIYYGLGLRIQRKAGGDWENAKEAVYGPGPVAYRLPLFSLPPGRRAGPHHGGTFDGVVLPRTLKPGKYRFLKQISGDGRSLGAPRAMLVAGFRVR
jgi:hypothetical protein